MTSLSHRMSRLATVLALAAVDAPGMRAYSVQRAYDD